MNIDTEKEIVFASWSVNDIRILAEEEENEAVLKMSDQDIWYALRNAAHQHMPFDPWQIVETVQRVSRI